MEEIKETSRDIVDVNVDVYNIPLRPQLCNKVEKLYKRLGEYYRW